MAVLILKNILADEQWGVCSVNLLLTFTRSSQVPNHPGSTHNVRPFIQNMYVSHVSVAPYILAGT